MFKEQKELSVSGHKGSGARPPCMEGGRGVLSSSAKESHWRLCGKEVRGSALHFPAIDRFAPWGQGTPAAVALAREAETE